ncbi:MAG: flagellar biosynthetic protein FliO [Verrucomicrobiota bacterium]
MIDVIEPWRLIALIFFMGGLVALWCWSNKGKIKVNGMISGKSSKINVIERRWIGSKESLILVEVEGEKYLLATGQGGSSWQKLESKCQLEQVI